MTAAATMTQATIEPVRQAAARYAERLRSLQDAHAEIRREQAGLVRAGR